MQMKIATFQDGSIAQEGVCGLCVIHWICNIIFPSDFEQVIKNQNALVEKQLCLIYFTELICKVFWILIRENEGY